MKNKKKKLENERTAWDQLMNRVVRGWRSIWSYPRVSSQRHEERLSLLFIYRSSRTIHHRSTNQKNVTSYFAENRVRCWYSIIIDKRVYTRTPLSFSLSQWDVFFCSFRWYAVAKRTLTSATTTSWGRLRLRNRRDARRFVDLRDRFCLANKSNLGDVWDFVTL